MIKYRVAWYSKAWPNDPKYRGYDKMIFDDYDKAKSWMMYKNARHQGLRHYIQAYLSFK
jgi:hypothetical protein